MVIITQSGCRVRWYTEHCQPAEGQDPGGFFDGISDEHSHPDGITWIAQRHWQPGEGKQRKGSRDSDVSSTDGTIMPPRAAATDSAAMRG